MRPRPSRSATLDRVVASFLTSFGAQLISGERVSKALTQAGLELAAGLAHRGPVELVEYFNAQCERKLAERFQPGCEELQGTFCPDNVCALAVCPAGYSILILRPALNACVAICETSRCLHAAPWQQAAPAQPSAPHLSRWCAFPFPLPQAFALRSAWS